MEIRLKLLKLAADIVQSSPQIKTMIKKAGIDIPPDEYIYKILRGMLISALLMPVFIILLLSLFIDIKSFWILLIVPCLSTGLVLVIIPTVIFLNISSRISSRQREIENALPFVSILMSALVASGLPPYMVFKLVSKFGKRFKELSRECEKIWRDTEHFGYTITEAIDSAIRRSPSRMWEDFLIGFKTTLLSGGNLEKYIKEKSERYLAEYERRLEKYAETVSFYLEIYISGILLGAIMGLVMASIMDLFKLWGGSLRLVQLFIVLVFLPVMSIMFILLIKASSPVEI